MNRTDIAEIFYRIDEEKVLHKRESAKMESIITPIVATLTLSKFI